MSAAAAWLLRRIRRLLAVALAAGVVAMPLPAPAQHAIDWHSVDTGGGRSESPGGWVVQGTFGQPDAQAMSAGGVVLVGGLWGGGPPDILFTDGFESPPGIPTDLEKTDEVRDD